MSDQESEIKIIQEAIKEMRMEINALKRCLLKKDIVQSTDFDIERHRARFEWYMERNPTKSDANNMIMDALLKHIAGVLIHSDGYTVGRLDCVSEGFHAVTTHISRVYVVGGLDMQSKRPLGGQMQAMNSVESLDILSGDWQPLTPTPTSRMRVGSAVSNGKLYIVGGLSSETSLACSDTDCLDMMKGSWMTGVAKMSMPRAACAAAGVNSRVYAIGGSSDGRRLLSSAECYAENTNSWVQIAPMSCPRGAFAAVSLHGYIYTLGGLNAQQTLSCAERFDPQSNVWEQLPSMWSPRAELAACAVAGRVFAIGGFNDKGFLLGTVEAYEPRICCWESMPALPQPVAACAAVVSKGHIYVLGGSDGRRTLPAVQHLVLGESYWRVGPPMRSPRMSVAAGTCLMGNWQGCDVSSRPCQMPAGLFAARGQGGMSQGSYIDDGQWSSMSSGNSFIHTSQGSAW